VARKNARRALRLVASWGGWALGGLALLVVLAVAAPLAFEHRPLQVLSGSMEPTLGTGDIAVVGRIAPAEARPGDVVTFRSPEGRLITHRVRSVRPGPRGRLTFVTRGDANESGERWTIARDGELSRLAYRVPYAGEAVRAANGTAGRLLLVTVPALLLTGLAVRRVWSGEGSRGAA
jgi:signal peptidase I